MSTLIFLLAPAAVIGAVYVLVSRRISTIQRGPDGPADWNLEISVDRYQPMLRLLSEDDIDFLRSQPAGSTALVKRLRRQRYRIFRSYLGSLQRDFHHGCEVLTFLLLQSQSDRRDIFRALFLSRVKFSLAVLRVHWRLLLYRWNIAPVPAGHLTGLVECLRLEHFAINPASDGARA
jgi:hypothetical protein